MKDKTLGWSKNSRILPFHNISFGKPRTTKMIREAINANSIPQPICQSLSLSKIAKDTPTINEKNIVPLRLISLKSIPGVKAI